MKMWGEGLGFCIIGEADLSFEAKGGGRRLMLGGFGESALMLCF